MTAPVFGTSERGVYTGAELFAGPKKFGARYYDGVLPNGRIVKPAGLSIQVGSYPLGTALTPDGKYLVTSNDDDDDEGVTSLQSDVNIGGYSLTVVDTASMRVVSHVECGPVYGGLQLVGRGPYTLWAAGGSSQSVKLFAISSDGRIEPGEPDSIAIEPLLPSSAGYVSHYKLGSAGTRTPAPSNFQRGQGAHITFPSGLALSPDGRFLYVACNGDNSLAVIDTATKAVVNRTSVGFFPYGVSVSRDGTRVLVSNWGIEEYKFANPSYDAAGELVGLAPTPANRPAGFYVPRADTEGANPRTSSISLLKAPGGDGAKLASEGAVYQGHRLDALRRVGDTHPSAMAIVRGHNGEVLYVTKSNSDSVALIQVDTGRRIADFDMTPINVRTGDGRPVHGAYPDAIAVAPDNRRAFVAEAGINAVAVLDTSDAAHPRLLGRIPTGWYPTAVAVSPDGRSLYVANDKGVGEDINPQSDPNVTPPSTGVEEFEDSNFIFGSVQKVDLNSLKLDNTTALAYNFAIHEPRPEQTAVVPVGGKPSAKIKHVFFILQENKTFDSMFGGLDKHFGPLASTTFIHRDGEAFSSNQNAEIVPNLRTLAEAFATAANYYSDSEESDAGHQFCSSGTSSDYSQKTLRVKDGRGMLANKNMEPEDYPEAGYIFNNAARHGVSFKDYGDLIRITGTDTGGGTPTIVNDPRSGKAGLPQLSPDGKRLLRPIINKGDIDSPTIGLGQSYFLALPDLAVLGSKNGTGEPHLDTNYPGYNFNISDQRRALEFIKDFDRMAAHHTLPQYLHIYLPNDHTGGVRAPNGKEIGVGPRQQIADGDVALGMVVEHILRSKAYYDPATGDGSVIFMTFDDAQGTMDHIHPHRTPLVVVSPYVKPGYVGKRHYVSASIVKTEELLLGLPPNNYGDLFATDLRDLFQPTYNGIRASGLAFTRTVTSSSSPEGARIWALVKRLDTSAPDRDSRRLGLLVQLSTAADDLHTSATHSSTLQSGEYRNAQNRLYALAVGVVGMAAGQDADD